MRELGNGFDIHLADHCTHSAISAPELSMAIIPGVGIMAVLENVLEAMDPLPLKKKIPTGPILQILFFLSYHTLRTQTHNVCSTAWLVGLPNHHN